MLLAICRLCSCSLVVQHLFSATAKWKCDYRSIEERAVIVNLNTQCLTSFMTLCNYYSTSTTATESYVFYVIERLDMVNQNLLHNIILDCFSTYQPQNPQDVGIIWHFSSFTTELWTCYNYPNNGTIFGQFKNMLSIYHVSVVYAVIGD